MSDVGTRCVVETETAPGAIGPYSQAIQFGELLFCSGALPLDPESGELVTDDLGAETARCLRNLAAVCEAAGTGLERALRLTVYTTQLSEFATINGAYGEFFAADPPARAAVGVAELPKGARVEIDAIVAIG